MRKIAPKLAAIIITFFIGTSTSLLLDTLNKDVVTSSNSKVEKVRNAVLSPPIYSQNATNAHISGRTIAEVTVSKNGMVISDNPLAMFRQATIVPAYKSRVPQRYIRGGENIKLRDGFFEINANGNPQIHTRRRPSDKNKTAVLLPRLFSATHKNRSPE